LAKEKAAEEDIICMNYGVPIIINALEELFPKAWKPER